MGLFLAAMLFAIASLAPAGEEVRPMLWLATGGWGLGVFYFRRGDRGRLTLVAMGLAAGVLALWWDAARMGDPLVGLGTEPHDLEGVVADREERDDSVKLMLEQVVGEEGRLFPGQVQILVYRSVVKAVPGDRVRLRAILRGSEEKSRVPGSFRYGEYLRRQGVSASGSAKGDVEVVGFAGGYPWNLWRQRISEDLGQHLPREQVGLVEAMLVGKRGRLDGKTWDDFQASGMAHLVSISGTHLGLVGATAFFLVRGVLAFILPLARRFDLARPAALIALIPVLVYGGLAGWPVPTQRSAVMVGLYLLSLVLGREHQGWRTLGFSAVIILFWEPLALFDASFLFSFVAVASLLAVVSLLPVGGWRGWVVGLLATSLAVDLATLPIATHHFHRITPWGMVANPLAIPWTGFFTLPMGLFALTVEPLSREGYLLLLQGMGWSLEAVRWLADSLAAWPGSWWRVAGPPLAAMVFSLAIGAVAFAPLPLLSLRLRLGFFTLAMLGLFWPRSGPPPGILHMAVLDVGQAQSVVVRTPSGKWSVFDAGGSKSSRFDVGEALISGYLWQQGVGRLERLVVSHPQSDHMAGAERVLRNFPVDRVWVANFPREERENRDYRHFLERAKKENVVVERMVAGMEQHEGEVLFTIYNPPAGQGVARDTNNGSLVVGLEWLGRRILLPADLEKAGENKLLAQFPQAFPVLAMTAPHHGSSSSSTSAFVAATMPRHLFISVGARNRWKFPKPEVVARWRQAGSRIWRTDLWGTLLMEMDETGVTRVGPAY